MRGLTNELNKKSKEASNLNARITELESLKVTAEGRSLKEAEEAFLTAKDEEIQKVAEERFNFVKAGWEQDKKPTEVLNAACNLLERSLKSGLWIKELAEKGVPEAVIKMVANEVNSRIDQEFIRRVEEESDKRALTKLSQLKNIEWPNWLRMHVEPTSRKLESKIVTNSLKLLEGPWTITCDKCMSQQNVGFNVEGVSQLLRNRYTYIECVNPNCRDFIGRHKIKVELEKLIYYYLTQG